MQNTYEKLLYKTIVKSGMDVLEVCEGIKKADYMFNGRKVYVAAIIAEHDKASFDVEATTEALKELTS